MKLPSPVESTRYGPRNVCPAAVVRLRLRFEESVGAVPAAILPPGWQDPATAATGPDAWRQLSAGPYTAIGTVCPSEVSYTSMPPRQASQVDVRIPWRTLPIDPRTLRSVGVEVFTDAITPDARLRWQNAGGAALPFDLTRERLRFIGTIDRGRIRIGKDRTLALPGRCFTGLLLDARLYPAAAASVDLQKPIDEVVRHLVHTNPSTVGMDVVWLGNAAAPTLEEAGLVRQKKVTVRGPRALASSSIGPGVRIGFGSVYGAAAHVAKRELDTGGYDFIEFEPSEIVSGTKRAPGHWLIPERPPLARKGAPRAAKRKRSGGGGGGSTETVPYLPIKDDTSVWDAITDITVQAGIVAWVRLDKVYLAPARNVFAGARRRRFVQARNCSDLEFDRDLGRRTVSAVEVRCWDSENRKRLTARHPQGSTPQSEDIIRVVQGVTSQADLDAVAEGIYLELRRQQLGGHLQTRAMVELGGDTPLIDLASGDVLDVQPALSAWDAGDLSSLKPAEIQARLEAAGVSAKVAVALASAAEAGRLTTFWSQEAAHRFSTKQGYELAVRFSELPTIGETGRGRDELLVSRAGAAGGNL